MQIVDTSSLIDGFVAKLKVCLHECAVDYSKAETHAVRNLTFGRLTAMLGDGAAPKIGLQDWRSDGVPGFRPLAIQCLNLVYKLAQNRLMYEELKDIERCIGDYDVVNLINYKVNIETVKTSDTKRWGFIWDSEEIVHKLLHSLDFLRQSAEFSEWYGRSFIFTANPLMLPFALNMETVDRLDMLSRIQHELTSEPYIRTAAIDLCTDWKYEGYLVLWNNMYMDYANEK